MKIYLNFLLALMVTLSTASATVFRVNNALPENAPNGLFSTIQSAHDYSGVSNGDTLMVEGSAKEYNYFTCTKRLVIIGPGYFLGENPGSNGIVTSALINGSSSFNQGSEGSYLIGLEFNYTVYINTNNIFITRSKIENLSFSKDVANCKITQSFIDRIYGYQVGSGITATNNVLGTVDNSINYLVFENNILTSKYSWKISAGTFRNNILLERDAKAEILSPNIQNNLAANAQFGTTNGNQAFVLADLFVPTGSSDGRYRLKADSPYLKAGYSGTQPGIFGGSEPYVLSGIPPVPIIYELNVPGTGSAASGLSINVKIRGAN